MAKLHIIAVKGNVEISKDMLWHGALYTTENTPSGAERVRLLKSDPIGKRTAWESVQRICKIYPDVLCGVRRPKDRNRTLTHTLNSKGKI